MNKSKSAKILAFVVLALTGTGAPADAHHSFAMFDYTKPVIFDATVKEFEWTNPHAVIWVERADGAEFPIECLSPGSLTRRGWTKRSLNPGDKVSVRMYPLKDGRNGGAFGTITLASTGQVLRQDTIGSQDRGDK